MCFFQIFLFLVVFFLKKTTKHVFTYTGSQGMLCKGIKTTQLYTPVLLITSNDDSLLYLQFFVKILFVVILAFFFNFFL
jgi:hypothetical protein